MGQHKLTPKAYTILKSKQPVFGTLLENETRTIFIESRPVEYDQELFEILRRKRKELADKAQLPPYVIFSDKTLSEMAYYYPMNEQSMRTISGIGNVKFTRYGEIFLDLIHEYCQARNLIEKPQPPGRPANRSNPPELSERSIQVGEAYNAGRSIQQLSAEQQVQPDTILQHLWNYAKAGKTLRQSGEFLALSHLPLDQQAAALDAFKKLGAERLKPIYEELGGTISYDELKILRLHYLSSLNT